MTILVVGAHPDDIEVGMGATIHKLKSKHTVHGLVLSSGARRGKTADRENATLLAGEILGYQPHFGRLPDGSILDHEAALIIEKVIDELQPELVFAHTGNDRHRDHLAAHRAAVSAARHIRNVLFFASPSSQGFRPQLFMPLSRKHLDAKVQALREHQKALATFGSYLASKNVRLQARSTGIQVKSVYAEGFEVDRLVLGIL